MTPKSRWGYDLHCSQTLGGNREGFLFLFVFAVFAVIAVVGQTWGKYVGMGHIAHRKQVEEIFNLNQPSKVPC